MLFHGTANHLDTAITLVIYVEIDVISDDDSSQTNKYARIVEMRSN